MPKLAIFPFLFGFLANLLLLPIASSSSPLMPSEDAVFTRGPRDPASYRLPKDTVPLRYELKLVVDPELPNFTGETVIRIRAVTNTSTIVLHNYRLNVTETTLKEVTSGNIVGIASTNMSASDDNFHKINLNGSLVPGSEYELKLVYDAQFNELEMNGFYRSSYATENGTMRYLATTKLEPTHARKVFPCYDEPALKAVFSIHVYAPSSYTPICNMDTIPSTQPPMEGFQVTSFRSTPLMSPYLVAIVVSDFAYKSNIKDGQVIYPREYRVYARPSERDALDHSLDVGQRTFQYLQAYTDLSYRLPKVDNVALPAFASGAMENWGLITYREEYMLYYKGITTTDIKMFIATIMSHENAHFWFGNEVSPLWWDYTWLNEGFATFFEFYATDKVYNGENRLMEQFVVNGMLNIMLTDSLPSTNAMTNPVGSPEEIRVNFNQIAYAKAGAVIRMFQHAFTESLFRLSITAYVKSLQLSAAEPEALYREMQTVIGPSGILDPNVTVSDVFGSWSEQAGYPIITVTRRQPTQLDINQGRFYQNSSLTSNQTWWMPLTWATSKDFDFGDTSVQFWLRKNQSRIILPIDGSATWYLFNKKFIGYYRVMYDIANWMSLIDLLQSENHSILPPLNKAQLIDDAALFSRTDRMTYNVTFGILNYLSNEIDWIPWTSANRVFSYLNPKMPASDEYARYRYFLSSKSRKVYDHVTLTAKEEDGYVTRRTRALVTRIACDAGLGRCLEDAVQVLKNSLQNDTASSIDPDVKSTVYCSAMRNGDQALWNGAFDRYVKNATSESDKVIIINGLGCTENATILETYFKMVTTNDTRLRSGDRVNAIRSAINAGPFGIMKVLMLMIDEFLALKSSLNGSTGGIIQSLGNVIASDIHIEMFNNFTMMHNSSFDASERAAIKAAETTIDGVLEWRNNYMDEIDAWLYDNIIIASSAFTVQRSFMLATLYSLYIFVKS